MLSAVSQSQARRQAIEWIEYLPGFPFTVQISVWTVRSNAWLLLMSINILESEGGRILTMLQYLPF